MGKNHLLLFLILFSTATSYGWQQPVELGQVFTLQSTALQEQREYRLHLPASYDQGDQSYPVVYVLDGDSYFVSVVTAVQTLSSLGAMPEAIVVGVSNPDRTSDLSPPDMSIPGVSGKQGDRFLQFLADELVTYMDNTYRTKPLRVLLGHSHGAIFSLYALAARPEVFRWQVALDAPMHIDDRYLEKAVEGFLLTRSWPKVRVALGWNRYEWSEEGWQKILPSVGPGFDVYELDLPGETHSTIFYVGFYKGLQQLFHDYAYQHKQTLSFSALAGRYRNMNESYGYNIAIPKWALMYGALDHLVAANAEEAALFVDRLEQDYGSPMVLGDNGRDWLNQLKSNPPAESRKAYLGRKDASVNEASAFIGSWKGSGYTIHIRDNGGHLEAEVVQEMPDGRQMSLPVLKISMNNGTLEIAQQNGMPPLTGIIYYKLQNPVNQKIESVQGFKVYWPKIASRNVLQKFSLTKLR